MSKLNIKSKSRTKMSESERILSDKSGFRTTELYKTLRTNIMYSLPKTEMGKKIVLTSAMAGDGKTTTSINLAISFAQMGVKILLIDCDMRKPKIHRYLGIGRGSGFSNVLSGFADVDKVIRRNVRPGLDVITAGDPPADPTELLSSQEFRNVLSKLEQEYDYVLIDTPPISSVVDAVLVSAEAMGAIIVIRQDETEKAALDFTVSSLKKANAKVLGFVMVESENQSKAAQRRTKYYYDYTSDDD